MAEERPPASLKKPPKPKSLQPEKPHRISAVEGKEMQIPLQTSHQAVPLFSISFASADYRGRYARQYLDSASPIASEISLLSVSDPEVDQPPSAVR